MDSKSATSRNRKRAAATMDSCRRQRKGNPCPARRGEEAMIFYWSHHTPGGVYRSAPLVSFGLSYCALQFAKFNIVGSLSALQLEN